MHQIADPRIVGVNPMRFFTICAKNYLAHAMVLGEQLKVHHPEAAFTIFLADKSIGIDPESIPFEIVTLEQLGLPAERDMIVRYNITELCTAIKPYCFLFLFDQSPEPVVYLDPDIFVVSPLVEVREALKQNDAVLTPHIVRPQEHGELRSETFLRYGIYNLGFLALGQSRDSAAFLVWWAERMETQGGIDLENGVFVDQKWADFVPAFIEKTVVLRHEGYNVAYWNLHNRAIEQKNGSYQSNGTPLRFVHFSAIPDRSDPSISKRYPVFTTDSCQDLGELLSEYRRLLSKFGLERFQELAFGYFLRPTAEANIHFPEHTPSGEDDAIFARTPTNYVLTHSVRSDAEYQKLLVENADVEQRRRSVETELRRSIDQDGRLEFSGFDALAGTEAIFGSTDVASDSTHPAAAATWDSIRGVSAPSAQSRSLLHIFGQELQPSRHQMIGVADAVGDCETWLESRSVTFESLQSVFGGRAEVNDGTASLDFVVVNSSDTLDCGQVLAQRVFELLVPGGHIIIGSGTSHFDQLGTLADAGFQNSQALWFWSERFGYLGAGRMVCTAQRPADTRAVKF